MSNGLLIVIISVIALAVVLFAYLKSKAERIRQGLDEGLTFEALANQVRAEIIEAVSDSSIPAGLSDMQLEKMIRQRSNLNTALTECGFGKESAKRQVVDMIISFLENRFQSSEEIDEVVDFNTPTAPLQFEILMYHLRKTHKTQALSYMIKEYSLDRERDFIEQNNRFDFGSARDARKSYAITREDIYTVFSRENPPIDYQTRIDVLALLIYQKIRGFGIIDTIREMDINGLLAGTSGSILARMTESSIDTEWKAPRSIWLYFQGKYIHLRFLTFGSEAELARVVKILIRYNQPGPITEKRGFIVNTMYDKSRILAIRPPVSEYWAFFIRKFTLSNATTPRLLCKRLVTQSYQEDYVLEAVRKQVVLTKVEEENLVRDLNCANPSDTTVALMCRGVNIPGFVHNAHLVVGLLQFLMKGQVTCGVTGRQGTGKTTLMSTLPAYMDPRHNIRVMEMAPELYLREMYPERNILSASPTDTVSDSMIQDAFKKTDAAISMVGEVATDEIASRMLQFARVASLYTLFSHHANRAEDLITGIRDSVVAAGNYSAMDVAERQVIEVIKMDIHLNVTADGYRYIERITEVIPTKQGTDYPRFDPKDPNGSKAAIDREYYRRRTDRSTFETQDLLVYDMNKNSYVAKGLMSLELYDHMIDRMDVSTADSFSEFMAQGWGGL